MRFIWNDESRGQQLEEAAAVGVVAVALTKKVAQTGQRRMRDVDLAAKRGDPTPPAQRSCVRRVPLCVFALCVIGSVVFRVGYHHALHRPSATPLPPAAAAPHEEEDDREEWKSPNGGFLGSSPFDGVAVEDLVPLGEELVFAEEFDQWREQQKEPKDKKRANAVGVTNKSRWRTRKSAGS